jgi:checkpoint serine/threonine-protein kinase
MALNEPVDFDIIEASKENIQALPSGRSARALAKVLSPLPTPTNTRTANDAIHRKFEDEIAASAKLDDPLDVWHRYVRWIDEAYPSGQATHESRLQTTLERATNAFVKNEQYKNDGRYTTLWLRRIKLMPVHDEGTQRETFRFLSQHGIGDMVTAFYVDYAGWLEMHNCWAQAEEVYRLGMAKDPSSARRLERKFAEFEARRQVFREQGGVEGAEGFASPPVRPALAPRMGLSAAATEESADPQAPRPNMGVGGGGARGQARAGKSKMAIFSDADAAAGPSAMSARGPESKGWDTIGSLAERKKENTVAPKPMAGQTLGAGGSGGKKATGGKMMVFRDTVS